MPGPGFFPRGYWPARYWADEYWPDYGRALYRPRWREMDRADYVALATLRPSRWTRSRGRLELTLEEQKRAWDVEIPLETYSVAEADDPDAYTWRGLDSDAAGRPVPWILGRCYDVPAVRIAADDEAGTATYHLAAHELAAVGAVRVDGVAVTPQAVDLAAATVTLAADDVPDGARVTADVTGALGADGAPIENPADAAEWLLRRAGATDADLLMPTGPADPQAGRGWGTYGARLAWLVGTQPAGTEAHAPGVAWYIAERQGLLDYLEELLAQVAGLTYTDGAGRLVLRPWALEAGEGALVLTEADVFRPKVERDPTEAISRVVARFRRRHDAGSAQAVTDERPAVQWRRGWPAPHLAEADLYMSRRADAAAWASRRLAMDGPPRSTWTVEAGARALMLEPGDAVRLVLDQPPAADLLEVAEVTRDLGAHAVRLVLVDRRGFGPRGGWWTDDAPTLPARLGGGAAAPWDAAWPPEAKAWARENLAYWCDDDGFPTAGETEERRPTVWS